LLFGILAWLNQSASHFFTGTGADAVCARMDWLPFYQKDAVPPSVNFEHDTAITAISAILARQSLAILEVVFPCCAVSRALDFAGKGPSDVSGHDAIQETVIATKCALARTDDPLAYEVS
jgi:hypothetical protein